ncbi:MAG TPA: hypothetical protein VFL46_08995, partial [Phycicoccus sp.]|nr:hypothetical protein [Phycicoccus sp.]
MLAGRHGMRTAAGAVLTVLLAVGSAVAGPGAVATPMPADTPVVPSAGDVARARAAAAAAARQVEAVTAQQRAAQAELSALQLEVATAVDADQRAQAALALAEDVARTAAQELERARAAHAAAREVVSGEAALLWTQGSGTLQSLDLMLSASPESVSDL